ncbi:MAG: transglycosylase domain-containing protein [Chitinophagales bacterium]|jgi:penicillin-binding protein 1A|nr:transglycosylase domain-containing protein [Chitinophagales bacterium]
MNLSDFYQKLIHVNFSDLLQLEKKELYKKFWKGFIAFYLLIILFFLALNFGLFGKMPSIDDLKNPRNSVASEVYSEDGALIGKIYTENRLPVTFNELPDNLVNALIATEDSRFYAHSGIDVKAIFAVVKGMFTMSNRGGGSTISQQLAKNLFPRGDVNLFSLVIRKFKEWIIAIKLERNFSKYEIIALYFNTVEYNDNAFGVKAAAKTYFNKNLKDLTIDESALLVGMLKAPSKYNPRRNPENAIERRNVVLSKMLAFNYINKTQYDTLSVKPIELRFNPLEDVDSEAPYFISVLKKYLKDFFQKNKDKFRKEYNIYEDGLKIYTTINMKMQKYANDAVREHLSLYQRYMFAHWAGSDPWRNGKSKRFLRHVHSSERFKDLVASGLSKDSAYSVMKQPIKMRVLSYKYPEGIDTMMSPWDSIRYYQMFIQAGFLAVDPTTGYIKSWVGGADYRYFKFDHVYYATKRQVGSVFKPFLYAVYIDQKGSSPCQQISNARIVFRPGGKYKLGTTWSPSNSGGGYGGMPTLKQALTKSLNIVSARLIADIGPKTLVNYMRSLGLDSTTKIPEYPSICLGTPEISVYEMVGAYTPFANEGLFSKLIFIKKIEDSKGNILHTEYPEFKEVLRPEMANVMQDMMKGVVDFGTAKRLKGAYGLKGEICGKTGTTQSNSDAWFIGFTPQLLAGVWTGCDDRLVRFRSTGLGQGAAMALPIWGKYFSKVYQDKTLGYSFDAKFPEFQEETRTIPIDCGKYKGWNAGIGIPKSKELQVIEYDQNGTDDFDNTEVPESFE